jgi:diaminopimelate decarboxylase
VTVESPGELARLEEIAAAAGRRIPVLLRAAIGGDVGVGGTAGAARPVAAERIRIIGDEGAGKFGMDAADLRLAARLAATSRHLRFLGLHRFGASNVLDAALLAAHAAETVAIARDVAAAAAAPLRLVDAGGGLGIPYGPDEEPLDIRELGRRLAAITERFPDAPDTRDLRLLLEPGRYFVGPAGAYLARVVDAKRVGGRAVAILDGGVHHLLRPALVRQEHRVRLLGPRATEPFGGPVTVAGPLCSGLDILSSRNDLPAPAVGDLVVTLDAGAYGFTESMPLFLSHAIPAEVAVRNGRAAVIRPRMDPSEWLERQVIPGW